MNRIIIVLVLGLILSMSGYFIYKKLVSNARPTDTNSEQSNSKTNQDQKWTGESLAAEGKFADADVIAIGDGKYRLYYSEEPEVQGFSGKIYSSISTDGTNWTQEDGVRKEMSTFPDVVKLANGTYRMYFQNAGVIKSATSTDGLIWKDEQGTRINDKETGFELDNVAASTTILLNDGTYLMVYRGTINEPYGTEKLPNQNTQLLFYATSIDGINFSKKGLAVDSRNSTLNGLTDGPDLIKWDNEIRLYFWTYSGIYHVIYQNNKFDQTPVFDYTNKTSADGKFPQNPPADPTLIKIADTWYMFYGQHTKGIYFTQYK